MKSFIFIALLATLICRTASYAICGDDSQTQEEEEATNEIVKRLMAMRKPDWGWDASAVAIALQVTVPERFFGRNKTAKAVENIIKTNLDKLTIRQKAILAITLKSMCLNGSDAGGINLVKDIADELDQQFTQESRYPKDGYGMFSIGIGSLCVTGYPINCRLVDNLLDGQNEDGSFAESKSIAHTVGLLPPIHCLSKMENPSYNVTRVDEAVKKMREFVIKNIKTDAAGQVYIGTEFWSSHALVSLSFSAGPNDDPATWQCNDVAKTLGVFPGVGETENDLVMRLLRLHGATFADAGDPNWKCVKTDPIPAGYVPTCEHDKPETCQPEPEPK